MGALKAAGTAVISWKTTPLKERQALRWIHAQANKLAMKVRAMELGRETNWRGRGRGASNRGGQQKAPGIEESASGKTLGREAGNQQRLHRESKTPGEQCRQAVKKRVAIGNTGEVVE